MLKYLLLFSLFIPKHGFCQLKFDTDTFHIFSIDSGTYTKVMGQPWYTEDDFTSDTIVFQREPLKYGLTKFKFVSTGQLEINACYIPCGKYICDYYGSWKETVPGKIEIHFTDLENSRNFECLFSYAFQKKGTILLLKNMRGN